MQIEISKTNYNQIMTLIDKACCIIKANSTNRPREYNIARNLQNVKNLVIRLNEKKHGK